MSEAQDYLATAQESLAGAESERTAVSTVVHGAPMMPVFRQPWLPCWRKGFSPESGRPGGHDHVQAGFVGQLVHRRKCYPTTLRRTLTDLLGMRHKAAYRAASVSQREAAQAVRRAQEFVREVTVRLSQSGEP